MTITRRLDQLEATLSPTERLKAWLVEAHANDTFDAFVRADFARGAEDRPLDRLAREAMAAAEAATRGRPREERQQAAHTAILQTVFRFQLVLRTVVLAQEFLDHEALVQGLICAGLAVLTMNDSKPHRPLFPSYEVGMTAMRDAAVVRASEMRAIGAARTRVEARYFDGVGLLFPAQAREWVEQLERTERIATSTSRLAELDGLAPAPAGDSEAFEQRVARLVANHVEPALSKAHDEMGDGRRAVAVAMRWLAPTLGPAGG
jgi:hypothetical protein